MYNAPSAQTVAEVLCAFATAGIIVNVINHYTHDPNRERKALLRRQAKLHRLDGNHAMATHYEDALAELESGKT